jgi:hypothetical protein
MLNKIIKKVKTSMLKSRINYFIKESKISSVLDKNLVLEKLTVFFSVDDTSNKSVIYAHPMLYLYEGEQIKSKLTIGSGEQYFGFYFNVKKLTYISKEEYVNQGKVVQIGNTGRSSGGSGYDGGSSNNNNNNNNNNNG